MNGENDHEVVLTPLMRVVLEKRRDMKIQERLLDDSTMRHVEIAQNAKDTRDEYEAVRSKLSEDEESGLVQVILTGGDEIDPFAFLHAYNAGLV